MQIISPFVGGRHFLSQESVNLWFDWWVTHVIDPDQGVGVRGGEIRHWTRANIQEGLPVTTLSFYIQNNQQVWHLYNPTWLNQAAASRSV